MVSKAREDLPEPETPVMTTSLSRGISTSMFLRLCSRAPRTMMELSAIPPPEWFSLTYHYRVEAARPTRGIEYSFVAPPLRAAYNEDRMRTSELHPWYVAPEEAVAIQKRLAAQVVRQGSPGPGRRGGGAGTSGDR